MRPTYQADAVEGTLRHVDVSAFIAFGVQGKLLLVPKDRVLIPEKEVIRRQFAKIKATSGCRKSTLPLEAYDGPLVSITERTTNLLEKDDAGPMLRK